MTDRELLATCTHLTVECWPRYWEDATINGVEDIEGKLIPFRDGELWRPVIELATGKILNWPPGMTANLCFKVCDQGRYYLGTLESPKLFQYGDWDRGPQESTYVPDDFLCHGEDGYGDYIILIVDGSGQIRQYERPTAEDIQWVRMP